MSKPFSTIRRLLDAGTNPITASLAAAGCALVLAFFVEGALSQTDRWAPSGNVGLFIAAGWALLSGAAMFIFARRSSR